MRFIYIALIAGLSGLIACNNATNTGSTNTPTTSVAPPKTASSKLGHEDTQKLMEIVSNYYALKNAFVATKGPRAADSAATSKWHPDSFTTSFSLKDSASGDAIKLYIDTIITESEIVHKLQDETCERQRIAFDVHLQRNVWHA